MCHKLARPFMVMLNFAFYIAFAHVRHSLQNDKYKVGFKPDSRS
jgi:hypothetical protein